MKSRRTPAERAAALERLNAYAKATFERMSAQTALALSTELGRAKAELDALALWGGSEQEINAQRMRVKELEDSEGHYGM